MGISFIRLSCSAESSMVSMVEAGTVDGVPWLSVVAVLWLVGTACLA